MDDLRDSEGGATVIAGVDGFKGKWVLVGKREEGSTRICIMDTIEEIFGDRGFSHIVIDVPIGLPENGSRQCDLDARRMIKRRRSSVFPAPVRGVLGASTYKEMCDQWMEIEDKKGSKQLFGILPLICEIDRVMTPELQNRVREGHPEVSFTEMNGGKPMPHHKATIAGVLDRLALVSMHYPDALERIRELSDARAAGDALDAYALLWTANRWREGRGKSLPEKTEHDARGLRMEMLY